MKGVKGGQQFDRSFPAPFSQGFVLVVGSTDVCIALKLDRYILVILKNRHHKLVVSINFFHIPIYVRTVSIEIAGRNQEMIQNSFEKMKKIQSLVYL